MYWSTHMKKTMIAAGLTMALSAPAIATNGYFVHGAGQSAKGAGGAGIAYPQDSLAAGQNPAGMSFIGNRADGGLEIFIPDRSMQAPKSSWDFSGGGGPNLSGDIDGNTPSAFLVPEGGYNMDMPNGSAWSFGVSAYGNGGMNATYARHPLVQASVGAAAAAAAAAQDPSLFPFPNGNTTSKIDLLQALILPTASYKINENHAVGVSLILAWQSLELINNLFPNTMNGAGHENSWGAGAKIGWQGRINDYVTLGATYQSKVIMSKMDDYRDAFAADDGRLSIPQTAGVGIAVNATEQLDILFDVVWINYSDDSMMTGIATNQGGFGWDDQTVFKLGAVYKYSDDLILRAGYNYAENPLPSDTVFDGFVSTIVPATVEHHLTLGFTKAINEDFSITGSYMHAFDNSVTSNAIPQMTASMYQNSVGLSLNWKL